MAIKPYWFSDTVTLAGNGTGTLQFRVGAGEIARFRKMRYVSTGAFQITGIRDSTSRQYSDASTSDPIVNTALALGQTDGNPLQEFNPPLEVVGDLSLLIDVVDTSGGSNTVRIYFEGEKETGG